MKGRCDCGKVAFEVKSPRKAISACHCAQCRRLSGHYFAATHAPFEDVDFETQEGLRWYTSSDWAKRGSCQYCGSSLFYRLNTEEGIGIAAACLEHTTGMKISKHIFVKDKGDYYDIEDGTEQIETF